MKKTQKFRKNFLIALFELFNEIPVESAQQLKSKTVSLRFQGLGYIEVIEAQLTENGHITRTTYIEIEDFIELLDSFGFELLDADIEARWADLVYRTQYELEELLKSNSQLFEWWNFAATIHGSVIDQNSDTNPGGFSVI